MQFDTGKQLKTNQNKYDTQEKGNNSNQINFLFQNQLLFFLLFLWNLIQGKLQLCEQQWQTRNKSLALKHNRFQKLLRRKGKLQFDTGN